MAEEHLLKIRDLFDRYDTDKDDSLDLNQLALLLQEISSKISPLPAVSPPCSIDKVSLLIHALHACSRLRKSLSNKANILGRS